MAGPSAPTGSAAPSGFKALDGQITRPPQGGIVSLQDVVKAVSAFAEHSDVDAVKGAGLCRRRRRLWAAASWPPFLFQSFALIMRA